MTTIGWGLIGCGDAARKRVARSQLVAACRRDSGKLNQFCGSLKSIVKATLAKLLSRGQR